MKYLKSKDEAHDLMQDLYEELVYDLKKHDIHNFVAWLRRKVWNMCTDVYNRKKREVPAEWELEIKSAQFVENPELKRLSVEMETQMLSDLKTELNGLKTLQRDCINLFYFHRRADQKKLGLTYVEVAEKLKVSVKTVKANIQNGRRNLGI
ncbi:MAG: sigma-70 family RNA polymerase sigma factor, partial [Bacteroidota bacterium]